MHDLPATVFLLRALLQVLQGWPVVDARLALTLEHVLLGERGAALLQVVLQEVGAVVVQQLGTLESMTDVSMAPSRGTVLGVRT